MRGSQGSPDQLSVLMAVHRSLGETISSLSNRVSRTAVIGPSFGTRGSKAALLVGNAGQQQPHSFGPCKVQAFDHDGRLFLHGLRYAGLYETLAVMSWVPFVNDIAFHNPKNACRGSGRNGWK